MSKAQLPNLWRAFLLAAAAVGGASGCSTTPKSSPVISVEPERQGDAWKNLATAEDEGRLDRLGLAWSEALDEARRQSRSAVNAEGDLLQPRAALPRPEPTPGSYNCRLVRLGRTTAKGPAFERFKPFFCYVQDEGDQLSLTKQTGSERPVGRLFDDDQPDRMIFLGTVAGASESNTPAYGEDAERNVPGVFERIAPFRWRLVIPWPKGGSKLDVYELTPVADQPEG